MEMVLDAIGNIKSLPEPFANSIPNNYPAMLTSLKRDFKLEMSNEYVYDVCPSCYHVYRGPSATAQTCPHLITKTKKGPLEACGEARYTEHTKKSTTKKGQLVQTVTLKARKTFLYRPYAETVQRHFKNTFLAERVTYHRGARAPLEGDICDFQDGHTYQKIQHDSRYAADARHLMVAVATDGVQPFKDDMRYSFWPLMVVCFNYPPWLRHTLGVASALGFIPGHRDTKDAKLQLTCYLEIFVDELEYMDKIGVLVYDAFRRETFRCHVKLVQVGGSTKLIQHEQVSTC